MCCCVGNVYDDRISKVAVDLRRDVKCHFLGAHIKFGQLNKHVANRDGYSSW